MTEVVTERLTPWTEPFHPPTELSHDRFLDRAQSFYRDILSHITGAFWVVDADGVVTYANDAVSDIPGLDENHLPGGGLDEIFDDETTQKLYDIRSNLKTRVTSGSFSITGRYRQRDGSPADTGLVWISGRSIHDPNGEYKSCLIGAAVLRGSAP
mgnify:CR=1 FL=1